MPKCVVAFEDLKSYLTSPLILSKPEGGKKLYLYLVVFAHAISSVLVRIAKGTKKLVYCVSKALEAAETRYFNIEKLAFALFVLFKKL